MRRMEEKHKEEERNIALTKFSCVRAHTYVFHVQFLFDIPRNLKSFDLLIFTVKETEALLSE